MDKDELRKLNAAELSAQRAASAARFAELGGIAKAERTIEQSQEIIALHSEIGTIDALTIEAYEADGLSISDAPVAPKAPVAPAAPATPVAEGLVIDTTAIEIPAGSQTEVLTPVQDTPEFAEAVAAAAALAAGVGARTVTTPHSVGETRPEVAPTTVVASASFGREGVGKGDAITLEQIGAIARRHGDDKNPDGDRLHIIDIQASAAPVLRADNSPEANTIALAEWYAAQNSVQAAAFTICGPPDILRSVPTDCVNDERYVDSWFPSVPTEHGAIQFYRPLGMADITNSTVVWGQTEQSAIDPADPSTWKPCATIPCLPTVTVGVEEIVQCLTMPTFQYMTSKESVASGLAAVRGTLARTADGHLLKLYDVLASKYSFNAATGALGAYIKMYDMLGRIEGAVAAAVRGLDLSGYTLAVETGFMETLELDTAMACNPRLATEAAAEHFGGLGFGKIAVTPDWSLADGGGPYSGVTINPPTSSVTALFARPTSFKVRIFRSGDFATLTPGGQSLGVVPDLDNMRQNKLTWFGAQYQGLAKLGCYPAFSIAVSGLTASGVRAACA